MNKINNKMNNGDTTFFIFLPPFLFLLIFRSFSTPLSPEPYAVLSSANLD